MTKLLRGLVLVALVLLVPVLPFLAFGEQIDTRVRGWFDPPPSRQMVALLTVAVLASDILLPVPSSVVNTLAGSELGVFLATTASWLGMTFGAVLGFAIARRWGRPAAQRFGSAADLERLDSSVDRFGTLMLIATRALPVLAEAAVLLLGASRMPWRSFLPAVALSNLGIAAIYSAFGAYAREQGHLALAIAASIALPLLAATIARRLHDALASGPS